MKKGGKQEKNEQKKVELVHEQEKKRQKKRELKYASALAAGYLRYPSAVAAGQRTKLLELWCITHKDNCYAEHSRPSNCSRPHVSPLVGKQPSQVPSLLKTLCKGRLSLCVEGGAFAVMDAEVGEKGEKHNEYRANTEYWRARLHVGGDPKLGSKCSECVVFGGVNGPCWNAGWFRANILGITLQQVVGGKVGPYSNNYVKFFKETEVWVVELGVVLQRQKRDDTCFAQRGEFKRVVKQIRASDAYDGCEYPDLLESIKELTDDQNGIGFRHIPEVLEPGQLKELLDFCIALFRDNRDKVVAWSDEGWEEKNLQKMLLSLPDELQLPFPAMVTDAELKLPIEEVTAIKKKREAAILRFLPGTSEAEYITKLVTKLKNHFGIGPDIPFYPIALNVYRGEYIPPHFDQLDEQGPGARIVNVCLQRGMLLFLTSTDNYPAQYWPNSANNPFGKICNAGSAYELRGVSRLFGLHGGVFTPVKTSDTSTKRDDTMDVADLDTRMSLTVRFGKVSNQNVEKSRKYWQKVEDSEQAVHLLTSEEHEQPAERKIKTPKRIKTIPAKPAKPRRSVGHYSLGDQLRLSNKNVEGMYQDIALNQTGKTIRKGQRYLLEWGDTQREYKVLGILVDSGKRTTRRYVLMSWVITTPITPWETDQLFWNSVANLMKKFDVPEHHVLDTGEHPPISQVLQDAHKLTKQPDPHTSEFMRANVITERMSTAMVATTQILGGRDKEDGIQASSIGTTSSLANLAELMGRTNSRALEAETSVIMQQKARLDELQRKLDASEEKNSEAKDKRCEELAKQLDQQRLDLAKQLDQQQLHYRDRLADKDMAFKEQAKNAANQQQVILDMVENSRNAWMSHSQSMHGMTQGGKRNRVPDDDRDHMSENLKKALKKARREEKRRVHEQNRKAEQARLQAQMDKAKAEADQFNSGSEGE